MKHLQQFIRSEAVILLACVFAASLATVSRGFAQADSAVISGDPGTTQCGVYVEAYKDGATEYGPYLKYTEGLAKTRDQNESVKRYTNELSASAPAANALWLKNWCSNNPLKPFAGAANHLLAALTDPPSDPSNHPSEQSQSAAPPANQPVPSSCRVGSTNFCSGCSITCNDGAKARCMIGTDSYFHNECLQQAACRCK